MIRAYGNSPFEIIVIHGGPGGIGSAGDLAENLSKRCACGVLEPLQSQYSIGALLAELEEQLRESNSRLPVLLIGHSWGAWLAGLFAERHPEQVRKLILIGSGPLRPEKGIDAVRRARFSSAEREEYDRLTEAFSKAPADRRNVLLKRLGKLCEKVDSFHPMERVTAPEASFDGEMFLRVWQEAAALRASGGLEKTFLHIRVPITIIHGTFDPHPADGVRRILEANGMKCCFFPLERCGHTPWREQEAADSFFQILQNEISDSGIPSEEGGKEA